jgi:hypothetical protein
VNLRGHVPSFGALESVEGLDFLAIENSRSEPEVSQLEHQLSLRLKN